MARNHRAEEKPEGDDEADGAEQEGAAKGSDAQPLAPLVSARQIIKRGGGRRLRKPVPEETEDPGERVDPPTAKHYIVSKGGRVTHSGMVQQLYTGKPITDVEYDIDSLRRQGIELEEQKPAAKAS